ncbi:MAG TPA: lipopolysaccharide biosynthesis protein [Novosphingobium sp.]|nr:lipopolysaccharide biosynthesis protein [Novosphingobium sp.]HQA17439.1 lipopolysaccharide biosynthesis protein [Novosphingobium sp.]
MTAAGANTPAAETVGQRAVQGVVWTYLSFAGSKLLIFASTVILARLLVPSEFGLVGFALLVIGYMDTVGDFGISSALIYEHERVEEAADVAFIVSLIAGLFWYAIAYAAAPWVAEFFREPEVVPIMRVMALSFVINALGNTHDAILRRDLAFKKRLVPDFAMAAFKGLCSVGFAFAGFGVWSLVWGQLIGTAAATIALWAAVPWRPGLNASWQAARKMLGYGGHIVSVNIVSAIVHDVDYLIVGRLLGATALGYYTLACRTPELLITTVIWVIGKVTFPVYAKLRGDPAALSNAFLVTLRYLSLITLPAGLGLAFLGGTFMVAFYGEKWMPAALTMQALAVAGALRSLGSHAGDVYRATGRPAILTKLGLLRAAVIIPAMIWGARYGILGVAVAQVIVTCASTVLNLVVAGRILSLSPWALFGEFKSAAIGSSAMLVVLALVQPLWTGLPSLIQLTLGVTIGAAVYFTVLIVIDRPVLIEARRALAGSMKR